MFSADTIFALATAPGKAAVAIIRISGPSSQSAFVLLTRQKLPQPRFACLVNIYTASDHLIDQALALYFPAPDSFTGEDIIELHTHGSMPVVRELLECLAGIPNLRHAEPGEFSKRAFLNGKMDLTKAEAIADLIDAETKEQHNQALRQMQGVLKKYYQKLRERIIHCLAHLEAYIDFPDENIPESVLSALNSDIIALKNTLAKMLLEEGQGERLREGIQLVILGAPNAGKSSLLNALAQRNVAIVSHKAGTTRDIIEVHLDIGGYPIIVKDTAGIRESNDEIEQEGIRRALQQATKADIKLIVLDAAEPPLTHHAFYSHIDEKSIVIINKIDTQSQLNVTNFPSEAPIFISTRTGEGIDALINILIQRIKINFLWQPTVFITRTRHRQLLTEAYAHLDIALTKKQLELLCEELRLAANAIGKITGNIYVNDILDSIFKNFCIGK